MKYIINLLIVALVAFLAYMLYNSIKEPIAFRGELNKRTNAVVAKLEKIRDVQEIHREIHGDFAPTFEVLKSVMENDSIPTVSLEADPADPTNPDLFIRKVSYSPAIDKIREMEIDLANLAWVPYTDKQVKFEMQADTTTYQSTLVPVMETMTRFKEFMGPFANARFRKYEKDYDPDASIGFGSMDTPNLEGNWK